MEISNITKINKVFDCIIDICEQHPPKYSQYAEDIKTLYNIDYFSGPLKKQFSIEEINVLYKNEQLIHSHEQFCNNNSFYNSFLDDFKIYMSKIINNKKKLLLKPKYLKYDSLFNSNIAFIYYYNFVYFLRYIANKFPEILDEEIFKIDLILMTAIFSPDYKTSFENGIADKYGINYESYTIMMIELIDLVKAKNYKGCEQIVDIENYEFKFPNNWNNLLNDVENDILEYLLFFSQIQEYEVFKKNKIRIFKGKPSSVLEIYEKFNNSDEKINIKQLLSIIKDIIKKIRENKSLEDKKNTIEEISNKKGTNDDYKLLDRYKILNNLNVLKELYSLNNNDYNLQKIHFVDLLENNSKEIENNCQFSSILDYIKNRPIIIEEAKKATNFMKNFKDIINNTSFRNNIKIILNSNIILKYYKNPTYYSNNEKIKYVHIGNKNFFDIYKSFLSNYINNEKIYERIIYKRMPIGVKGAITPYLSFIIDPFGIDMRNNIQKKEEFIEAYLIILFIHETNHLSKRSFNLNIPLSTCKTPKNAEGGESIIRYIFGKGKISIIDENFCGMVNNIKNWESKNSNENKIFKQSLAEYVNNINIEDENQLIKIKEEKNCLISFFNYKSSQKGNISYSGSNGGLFCF